ncbi:hypothetical protein FOZ63_000069, partial [Perkinsus olseni]
MFIQVSTSAPTNEEPLPPLDPELGVLALEWAPDLAEILRRYDSDWDKDMIEFAFSYWSAEIEKVKARQGDRIACRMNGLFKVPETADSIWEVANVVRTQNKGRNAYLLLLRFERDSVFEEVVTKNPDLQRTEDAIWIGFTKTRRDSYIILDDWFRKKKDIKAVDPRVYRQWLDTREEIEPEPKPKSRNTSVPTTPLSGASMVNHHPSITFDSFKKAEELGKQAAQLVGDTGTPASGRRKRNSVIEAEQRMQLQAQHKELSKKLRQEMQQQKSEAKNKKKIAVVVEPSAPISETPVALPKAPEAVADTPVETPPRKKRGRPPKGATSAKRKKEEVPSTGQPEKETAGATEPKTPVSVKGGIPEVPESASSSSSLPPPSTPSGSDEEGSVRRHSRRRRGHMDAAEAYRLAACQGLVDTNPYDKWAHDAAEAQQTRIAEEEKEQESEAEQAAVAVEAKGNDDEEEDREVREKEIEEKRKELKEKQQEKARLKAEIKAHRKEQQERIVEQVLQMEHDKAAALDGVAAGGTKSDSVRRDAASGIIRIRAKPSPVPSSTMPTSLPEGEVPAAEGSSSSSSFSAARPGELLAQAAEEAVREVQELSPSPSEAPTPSMSSGFHGDDEEPADEVMESEASVGDEGSDYEEDDIVTVGRRVRGVKRSTPAAAAAGTAATTSKSKRRRGPLVTAGSKRRSSVSSPSGNADEPKSPGGLFSPGGDGATSTVNPRKLYREKATEGFRKLFEAGDVADDEESKEERCRKWATELEAALFITTGGKNGESGWQKYLEAMKRLVPVIKDTQSKEKQRHLKREGDDAQASPLLTRPIGVTGLLLRGRLSVDQLASKHCTSEWLQEMIGWDDLLLEDPTSDNRVKPIQGLRGILFRECLDPSKGVIHPGKRSAMQCHLWSYALEHEMHASSNDAASYRQAIGGLVRKLRELESNSLPAFRLLHTNKITCKRLASTSAGTIVSENAPHRASSAASSGGSTPGGSSSPKAASPAESSAAAVVLSRTAPTAQSTEPDLYDDLAVDAGVPKLPLSGSSEPTSVSLKRVASALITAEEELQESAPDFAPAPMIMMEDDESDDDEG